MDWKVPHYVGHFFCADVGRSISPQMKTRIPQISTKWRYAGAESKKFH
jgi:hypothetical protein